MLVTNQIHGPVIINIFGPADAEGNRPVIGQVSGSHWNVLRSAMTADLEQYSATPDPSNPRALWSGDEIDPETGQYKHTAFLRFETAEDAQAAFEKAGLWLQLSIDTDAGVPSNVGADFDAQEAMSQGANHA